MAAQRQVEVLVVGAGPAGLTAAITLARHGIAVIVADRRAEPSTLPRATVISTRAMELLRSWGLREAILRGGNDVEWLMWISPTLARAGEGAGLEVGYPSGPQAAVLSPAAPACVPQDHLERVLLEHLRSLPSATVLQRTEATLLSFGGAHAATRSCSTPSSCGDVPSSCGDALSSRGDVLSSRGDVLGSCGDGQVAARLHPVPPGSGDAFTVTARYLVAADGVHGSLRAVLGIGAQGTPPLMEGASVLFHAPLWELLGRHRYGIYCTTDTGGIFLPAGPGDRWKYAEAWDPPQGGGHALSAYTPERFVELIRRAAGVPDLAPRLVRTGTFSASVRLADRFRAGNAFLTGDAAHQITPRGGTGLNTALQDGHDIGWKLAWVLRGWAGAELLDSYEAERRPVAEHNAARSADPHGSRRPTDEELHADLGGRIRHAWLPAATPGAARLSTLDPPATAPAEVPRLSTLDLLGPGLTLLTAPDGDAWRAAAAAWRTAAAHRTGPGPGRGASPSPSPGRGASPSLSPDPGPFDPGPFVARPVPLDDHALDHITATALGLRRGGALLVRPDGSPAAWWPAAPLDAPAAAVLLAAGITGATHQPAPAVLATAAIG